MYSHGRCSCANTNRLGKSTPSRSGKIGAWSSSFKEASSLLSVILKTALPDETQAIPRNYCAEKRAYCRRYPSTCVRMLEFRLVRIKFAVSRTSSIARWISMTTPALLGSVGRKKSPTNDVVVSDGKARQTAFHDRLIDDSGSTDLV